MHPTLRPPRDNRRQYGQVRTGRLMFREPNRSPETYTAPVSYTHLESLNYQRQRAPWFADPRRAKVRFVAEQMKIHLDRLFAENFFVSGAWSNEWTGVASTPSANQFVKFSDENSDPVTLIDQLCDEVEQSTGCLLYTSQRPVILCQN